MSLDNKIAYWILLVPIAILGFKVPSTLKSFNGSKTTYELIINKMEIRLIETSRLGKRRNYAFPKENYDKFFLIPYFRNQFVELGGTWLPYLKYSSNTSFERLMYINGEEQVGLMDSVSNEEKKYVYDMIKYYAQKV